MYATANSLGGAAIAVVVSTLLGVTSGLLAGYYSGAIDAIGAWVSNVIQALPGIITGVILGLLRAAGETAPILFTVAAFYLPQLPGSPFDQTMALPYHLYVIVTQVPGMPAEIQYGTALVLLVLVLSLNLVATLIRSRFRRQRQW